MEGVMRLDESSCFSPPVLFIVFFCSALSSLSVVSLCCVLVYHLSYLSPVAHGALCVIRLTAMLCHVVDNQTVLSLSVSLHELGMRICHSA